ncbi:MAG: phospho-sugar mutase [Spirochaetes bacterium]|nr:phospho-sugar mutase [Spirochaetota bacterium]
MDEAIRKKIDEWTRPPFDPETIREIQGLVEKNDERELTERFHRTLEFGTGGLRGVLGAGTNRMNVYTVGMATQGLANYIRTTESSGSGVVIARDSRRFSDIFANEAAAILAANGIPVYLFRDITPTPIASYAIRHLKAASGIVITASHNPPEYNGYKVYWDDGGQITPPHDKRIIQEVNRVTSISDIRKIDLKSSIQSGVIRYIGEEITASYIADLEKAALRTPHASAVKIAYTPLHGTGYRIIPEVLRHFGFSNICLQEEQSRPDGNFPTVSYPNPEEKEAMEMVTRLAKKEGADILLATDPDADRMGVGFRGSDGEYILINGNQIGTMLEYYLLSRSKENGTLPENAAVVKTIVTTELQRDIAASFGCGIHDVLTGFKWIAAKMKEFDDTGSARFIFGGEESYGYLPVSFVRDKDAVSSCYFFAEMADWLAGRNMTLAGFLDEIYTTFGLYVEDLHSLTLKGMEGTERIRLIMDRFRTAPPAEFSSIKVARIADIQDGTIRDITTGKVDSLEGLPPSNVLQFFLDDGSKITMRPSGTEPKIKFYFSVKEPVDRESFAGGKDRARGRIEAIKKDLLKKIDAV